MQSVSHLTDYLLHEKFQSGFRPGPSPEASVNSAFYNLLIVIQNPVKPGLYLARCIGSIWCCWSVNAGPPSTPYETFRLKVNTKQALLLEDVSVCLSPNVINGT